MAFPIRTVNPLDINPSTGVGVSLNYGVEGVFETTYTTFEATKNNLLNFLLTGTGERYLNPTFGFGLQSYLFEQLDDVTNATIQEDIQVAVSTYFPTVTIDEVNINLLPDTNQLDIKLTFSIGQQSDTVEITLG